jgi:hypothetical protein
LSVFFTLGSEWPKATASPIATVAEIDVEPGRAAAEDDAREMSSVGAAVADADTGEPAAAKLALGAVSTGLAFGLTAPALAGNIA